MAWTLASIKTAIVAAAEALYLGDPVKYGPVRVSMGDVGVGPAYNTVTIDGFDMLAGMGWSGPALDIDNPADGPDPLMIDKTAIALSIIYTIQEHVNWVDSGHINNAATYGWPAFDAAGASTLMALDATVFAANAGDALMWDGAKWTASPTGGLGTLDHAALSSNLAWGTSGHTGVASSLAAWTAGNVATTVLIADFATASHTHPDVIAGGASGFMIGSDKTKLNLFTAPYVHPNHSGDVTSAGDGAQTIATNAVSNTKLADMATQTIKGRVTAGTGDPEDLTTSQVAGLIDHAALGSNLDWTNTGHTGTALNFAIFDALGNADFLAGTAVSYAGHSHSAVVAGGASGFMIGTDKTKLDLFTSPYVHPNHSGDVTSVGDGAQTIAANAVNNIKLDDMATQTVKGRNTGGTGNPEDLSMATLATMLGIFSPGYLSITVNASSTLSAAKIDAFANGSYAAPSFISDVTASNASHTASTGLMTATNAGTYKVTVTMVMDAAVATNVVFSVERNSIGVYTQTARVNTTNTIIVYSFQITMTAGQYLEVFFDSNTATNVQCKAGTNFNFHRIA